MRSSARPRSPRSTLDHRGLSLSLLIGLIGLIGVTGCGSAPPPPPPAPAPETTAVVEQPAVTTAPTVAPSAKASAAPEPPVIHRSEIYGSVGARKGKVLDLLALVMTSTTTPPIGTKAMLFRKAGKKESGEWIQLGEVTLKKFGDEGKIEAELSDEPVSGKGDVFKKGLSIKIQIDQ
ncbi:MAG: hypothetical protein U0359_34435 [Byssovorax sp.]